jgi:DNA-directed RNA polymerase I, II, and III subunit RPABC2
MSEPNKLTTFIDEDSSDNEFVPPPPQSDQKDEDSLDDEFVPPPPSNQKDEDSSDDEFVPPPPSNQKDDDSDVESVQDKLDDDSDVDSDVDSLLDVEQEATGSTPSNEEHVFNLGQSDDNYDDDDDEDYSDDDEDYLQKFDSINKKEMVAQYHPELLMHNNEEVEMLSKVTRNNQGVIIDPLHRTLPFITKYERARVIGERARQLNMGAKPMVEVAPDMIDGYLIALVEFEQKRLPFIIKRPMPDGGCEYWKFKDLEMV